MKKYKLGEICQFNERTISRQQNRIIDYLDTSSLVEGEILSIQTMELCEAPNRAQRIVRNNTILYSLVRPALKHYGILSNPEPSMIVSTGFVTIDIKEEYKKDIHAYFLYLLITQDCITNYLQGIAESATSAYPSIVSSDLSKLAFDFPTINEQRRISNLFQSINSKTMLNRAINHNLPNTHRYFVLEYISVSFIAFSCN